MEKGGVIAPQERLRGGTAPGGGGLDVCLLLHQAGSPRGQGCGTQGWTKILEPNGPYLAVVLCSGHSAAMKSSDGARRPVFFASCCVALQPGCVAPSR